MGSACFWEDPSSTKGEGALEMITGEQLAPPGVQCFVLHNLSRAISAAAVPPSASAQGHEERFLPPRVSAGCGFS